MRFTSRSKSDNFHFASREMSKSYFLRIDASATPGKELLVDESSVATGDYCGHPSPNSSWNLLLL